MDKEISVKESNSVYNHNHTIITAHAVDLRERMFLAESAQQIAQQEQAMLAGEPNGSEARADA